MSRLSPGPLERHGHVETDSPSYMLGMVGFGADTLAGAGAVDADAAEALEAEARRRADTSRFLGHMPTLMALLAVD